jgi:hypothetical protein
VLSWSDGEEGFDLDTRVYVLLSDAGVSVFTEVMSNVSALRGWEEKQGEVGEVKIKKPSTITREIIVITYREKGKNLRESVGKSRSGERRYTKGKGVVPKILFEQMLIKDLGFDQSCGTCKDDVLPRAQ